ncbi:M10 family metallopeptidase domain-containing protein [Robiginitalea sediminis]|uniref:hypothetical protein n=1 Tax=Robiginitalea sediminis TaxID=1982593 RepID=UPI000B4BEA1A|nr:hypothetical protein [Robiginitalea sediminis]
MKKPKLLLLAAAALLVACQSEDVNENPTATYALGELKMVEVDIPGVDGLKGNGFQASKGKNLKGAATQINQMLEPYGVQLEKMEYYSIDGAGKTVFFSDRGNKQLSSDYVPNDPRNLGGLAVPYLIDGTQLNTASGFNTLQPIVDVMDTWANVTCSSGLDIPFGGVSGADIGFVSNVFFGFGGSNGFFPGVIVHAGTLPKAFFDAIAPGGGNGILGVTFTLTWTDDINGDGKGDVAIKEIYYNDAFNWQDRVATGTGIDFQTVALHEVGHALSQAHFGKLSRTEANGKLHFSPRALMNAGYTGVNRVVEKTDQAGHCSNWSNWPNN